MHDAAAALHEDAAVFYETHGFPRQAEDEITAAAEQRRRADGERRRAAAL